MTRTRYKIYETTHPYFLTCTVVGWIPIFTRNETVEIVLDSWRFLQDNGRLTLYGFVIMENHLHWIASADDLADQVSRFKSFTARKIIDWLAATRIQRILAQLERLRSAHKTDRIHQLWQEGCHPQMIQGDEMMWQKLEYIHNNPVARGYVDDPMHWRRSSARNYAGQSGLISVSTQW
jgi:putative transposase